MRLYYLVAAHNEQNQIARTCARLLELSKTYDIPGILLLENGSTDSTFQICQKLENENPGVVLALKTSEAGIGAAFQMGLKALPSTLGKDDWIVLAAADLPFGFSDLQSVEQEMPAKRDVWVFVGSKSHPKSQIARNWKRAVGSFGFHCLRKIILGIKTKDTQGSIFIRGDVVDRLKNFSAKDYFFSVQIIDRAEREGHVIEVPIILEPDIRPSRVRLVRDGWRLVKQLLIYRLNS